MQVLAEVEEHVDQGEAYLAWRAESAGVVALVPNRSLMAAAAVDGARAANREALEATGQRLRGVPFDDKVEVVGLDGEMKQAERAPARGGECAQQLRKNRGRAE